MAKALPLREQAFRYLAPLLGLAVGIALVALVLAVLPGGLRDFWWLLLVVAVVGSGAVVGAVTVGTVIGHRLIGDHLEMAVRLPDGKWRHGRARLSGRHFTFEPYLGQVRIPSGQVEHFELKDVEPGSGRRAPLRAWVTLAPGVRTLTLTTRTTPLQVAAYPSRLAELHKTWPSGPHAAAGTT